MPTRILIVEDDRTSRQEMIQVLKASNPFVEIFEASDGIAALKILAEVSVDLVIADLVMPHMDGGKLLSAIRQDERFEHTPVIIVTSKMDIRDKLLSFERGAQDYLIKPFHPAELVARTQVMLRLRAQVLAFQERAVMDGLTGLYNQNYLAAALERELRRSQRNGLNVSCLMIDVDDFKVINDVHGHLAGDEVLRTIGRLLRAHLRGYDFAVRYGGDEFLVVLAQNTSEGAMTVAERLREVVSSYVFFPGEALSNPVRVTIGVASVPAGLIDTAECIIRAADRALYQAKAAGKNQVRLCQGL
ncbi:MAG: diguanylate cyclase [Nitrospirota bacterium]